MSKFLPPMDATKFAALTAGLTDAEQALVALATNKSGIRATKPAAAKTAGAAAQSLAQDAAFVWRWVVFQVSKNPQHQCMPCLVFVSDAGLPPRPANGFEEREAFRTYHDAKRAKEKGLMALADRMVNCVNKAEWHGVARWGRAMGR